MLNNLHVKNLALIDEVEVEFGEGLNILSGETGAGKSIIIGSLGLALGDRADSDAIRAGAEYALVELTLTTGNKQVWDKLSEMGITKEDDTLLIQRRIYPGRSVCRINGETITLKELAGISELLIDICGQRESLKLLKNNALKEMLDDCAGEKMAEYLEKTATVYRDYKDVLCKLDESDEDDILRKKKADLAEFEITEIEEAGLTIGEDEELENDYRRMQHSSRINEGLGIVTKLCGYDDDGAAAQISRALREIRGVSDYDERIAPLESMLYDLDGLSSDLVHGIRDYMEESEFDPERFAEVESRLNLINRLKDKYGRNIEAILAYRDEKALEVDRLKNYELYMAELERKKAALSRELDVLCSKIHELRDKAATELSKTLTDTLEGMNFLSCNLKVEITANPERYTATGYDDIDFCISLNPGEPLRPISTVASGGELSRIMLAIKCVSAERDNVETLVFDEIDTGISGVTAWKVAGNMSRLSHGHQVICITHQAQIAAFADKHFLIEKKSGDNHTATYINSLSRGEMESELARMMGAEEPSAAALSAATELKASADKEKAQ